MFRKSLFTCLIFIFVSVITTQGQSESDTGSVPFQTFNKGFNLNFINGYALGYKWGNTSTWSSRIYLTLDLGASDSEGESEYNFSDEYNTSQSSRSEDESESRLGIILDYQFLNNFYSIGNFRAYGGGGLYAGYMLTNRKSTRQDNDDESTIEGEFSNKSYLAGIVGILGIEVEITPSVSLFAESHLRGGKSWNTYEYKGESNNLSTENRSFFSDKHTDEKWSISFFLVKAGIGIYF